MKTHKNKSPFRAAKAMMLGLTLAGGAEAAQVESALPDYFVGVSVADLLGPFGISDVAAPSGAARPAGMGNAIAGVHLGTNTDIFAVGNTDDFGRASQFWVRYTLDSTSSEYHSYTSWENPGNPHEYRGPVSGSLWLSFDLGSQSLRMHTDKLSGELFKYSDIADISIDPGVGTISTLFAGGTGHPDYQYLPGTNAYFLPGNCIECQFEWTLNLAFLQLSWNGSGYDLLTSAQGFDQIYTASSRFSFNDVVDEYQANIAPVPVPGALWLFGSSLAGLVAVNRRRSAVANGERAG